MVERDLTYPGDNGHDLFEFSFFITGGCFLRGGDSSTMRNVWYT